MDTEVTYRNLPTPGPRATLLEKVMWLINEADGWLMLGSVRQAKIRLLRARGLIERG